MTFLQKDLAHKKTKTRHKPKPTHKARLKTSKRVKIVCFAFFFFLFAFCTQEEKRKKKEKSPHNVDVLNTDVPTTRFMYKHLYIHQPSSGDWNLVYRCSDTKTPVCVCIDFKLIKII